MQIKVMIKKIIITYLAFSCVSLFGQDWNPIGQSIVGSTPGNKLGLSFDINIDGTVMAIGEPLNVSSGNLIGKVTVYTLEAGNWVLKGNILTSTENEDMFGNAVSLSNDGNILAIGVKLNDEGGINAGKVCLFQFDGSNWISYGNVLYGEHPGDVFGASVELNGAGDRLAVGIIGEDSNGESSGKVEVFQYQSGNWSTLGTPMYGINAYNGLGVSLRLSEDGNTLIASAGYLSYDEISKGYICVFRFDGTNWIQISPILWGDNFGDLFGNSVAISSSGNTIIIGAPFCNSSFGVDAGAVKVLDYDGTNWNQRGPTFIGNMEGGLKGKSVSISRDGNTIAMSEPNYNNNGFMSGKVSVFQWNGANWLLKGSELNGNIAFDCAGSQICICGVGDNIVIGIPGDDEGGNDAGKVLVYRFN